MSVTVKLKPARWAQLQVLRLAVRDYRRALYMTPSKDNAMARSRQHEIAVAKVHIVDAACDVFPMTGYRGRKKR